MLKQAETQLHATVVIALWIISQFSFLGNSGNILNFSSFYFEPYPLMTDPYL